MALIVTRLLGRGSAAVAALAAAGLLLAVPAAGPAQSARFDLWTGTWEVGFTVRGSNTAEFVPIVFELRDDGRVSGTGPSITFVSDPPPSGLRLQGLLYAEPGAAPPSGYTVLRAGLRVGATEETHTDFHAFTGTVRDLNDKEQLASLSAGYTRGGPQRALVRPLVSRSRRIADTGDTVQLGFKLVNEGPSGVPRAGTRLRLTLNVDPAQVDVLPRTVRRCDDRRGRFARQTIVDCLLLALGPTRPDPLVRLRINIPRYMAGRRLVADAEVSDADARDRVRVSRVTGSTSVTVLPRDRQPPPPPPPPPPIVRLAGQWRGNDGGRFTLTQRGREVRWKGRSADNGTTWTHNFRGFIRGRYLVGNFQDVPPGSFRNKGALALRIVSRTRLDWVAQVGSVRSFPTATRRWRRCAKSGCPAAAGRPVPFAEPRIVDRIKILGFPYEAFTVIACDPDKPATCDARNPKSDLRQRARAFCQRRGTTLVAPETRGLRIGGQTEAYAGEFAAGPYATRRTQTNERWVDPLNGLVGYTSRGTVFSQLTCRAG